MEPCCRYAGESGYKVSAPRSISVVDDVHNCRICGDVISWISCSVVIQEATLHPGHLLSFYSRSEWRLVQSSNTW